jgi:predicted DNA-binding transcriptional regulator YafY
LYAFDLDRQAPRVFRLDRIGAVRREVRRFQPKDLPEPVLAVAEAVTRKQLGFAASVLVPPGGPARWNPERVSFIWRSEAARDPAGWIRLVFLFDQDERALASLANLRGDWILESPSRLVDLLAALGRNAAASERLQRSKTDRSP